MRRRGFLKAMVATAAGCLAVTPRVVRSLQAGTLTKGWTKEEESFWSQLPSFPCTPHSYTLPGGVRVEFGNENWIL